MNIKSLLLGSVITLGSLFTFTGQAQARTCFDVPEVDGAICNEYKGQTRDGYSLYSLGYVDGGNGSSRMDVVCDGQYMVRWQSRSTGMSRSYNESLAKFFCSI